MLVILYPKPVVVTDGPTLRLRSGPVAASPEVFQESSEAETGGLFGVEKNGDGNYTRVFPKIEVPQNGW